MPYKPNRPCRAPGCPHLVNNTTGYCPVHSKQADIRGSAAERGYDNTWAKIRRQFLMANPLCSVCQQAGRTQIAEVVHHINRNPKDCDVSNLVGLCVDCHAKEHSKDKKIRNVLV